MAKKPIRPCVVASCRECIEAILEEGMHAMQAAGFESAARLARVEASDLFGRGINDDMAKAFRDFAFRLDRLAGDSRAQQKISEHKPVNCNRRLTPSEERDAE